MSKDDSRVDEPAGKKRLEVAVERVDSAASAKTQQKEDTPMDKDKSKARDPATPKKIGAAGPSGVGSKRPAKQRATDKKAKPSKKNG